MKRHDNTYNCWGGGCHFLIIVQAIFKVLFLPWTDTRLFSFFYFHGWRKIILAKACEGKNPIMNRLNYSWLNWSQKDIFLLFFRQKKKIFLRMEETVFVFSHFLSPSVQKSNGLLFVNRDALHFIIYVWTLTYKLICRLDHRYSRSTVSMVRLKIK